MKPYTNPKDDILAQNPSALVRKMGKKRKQNWKRAAVAKAAPQELDVANLPEDDIHDLIESEVQEAGYPYVSIREHLYGWLKDMVGQKHWQAAELLEILKDLPDFVIIDEAPGLSWSRCLMLELKRRTGTARPGQKRLAEAVGGTIAKGYTTAHEALQKFISRSPT